MYKIALCKGIAAEHTFAALALNLGWQVSQPLVPCPADFVINRSDTWETVQVKLATKDYVSTDHGTRVAVSLRFGTGRKRKYINGDFDLLAVIYNTSCWLIPFDQLGGAHLRFFEKPGRGKYEKWRIA